MTMQMLDLAGRTFGQLKILSRADRPDRPMGRTFAASTWWTCRCSCGAVVVKNGPEIKAGRVASCGQHAQSTSRGVWTDETIGALRTLWSEGHSSSEIGRRLGFSRNAIIGKKNRLGGIEARESPIIRSDQNAPKAPASIPRSQVTLPPLPSQIDVLPLPAAPKLVMQKPLPVSLVPLPAPVTIRRGGCQFPLWGRGKPEFRPDGSPMVCDAPALGPWCPTHRAVCFTRRQSAEAA